MTRYFAPISAEALAQKVREAIDATGNGHYPETLQIVKDMKCQFDCENFDDHASEFHKRYNTHKVLGVHILDNGLTYWGMMGGGDWEYPVYFIIYWDGKKLRAYVPTAGNNWNTDTHTAYGNDEEADRANMIKRFYADRDPEDIPDYLGADDCPDADGNAMLEEIKGHILPKEPKAKAKTKPKPQPQKNVKVELAKASGKVAKHVLKKVSDAELLAECRRRLGK